MKMIIILGLYCLILSAQTLSLGIVPRYNINQIRDQWLPLTEIIFKKTGVKIVLKTEAGVSQFLKAYQSGAYDLAYSNPGHYILANKLEGYTAIISSQKMLRGMIVSSSKHKSLNLLDLKGKSFAFPSPSAFAATIMPRIEIYDIYKFDILQERPAYVNTLQKSMLMAKLNRYIAAGTAYDVFSRAAPK